MIIYDRGSQFIARFWEQLHASLGTHLIHSLAYHPQTDGQTKRVNQILEDMLRTCVMEYSGSWDKNLSWAEFSYNNNYQESLKMAPFEEVHDIFHVSQLKKFLKAPVDVVLPEVAPLEADLTSRASDQDLGSKESCYEVQDNQVLQDPMEQPCRRRNNMGKRGFTPFLPFGF
jgi:transposase InsO family protein